MQLPDVPRSWLVAAFLLSMVVLRAMSIDSYTTAGLAAIAAYLFGFDMAVQRIKEKENTATVSPPTIE